MRSRSRRRRGGEGEDGVGEKGIRADQGIGE